MFTTIRRILCALPVVVVLWVVLMAVVMRLSDAAPAAVVILPATLDSVPEEAAIIGYNRAALTLANRPGLTGDLYGAGAWLVLPAGLTGCLPLTGAQRAALVSG